ncbi:hypothetical protein CCACVL1_01591, partial [Corchorus capsularis]
MKFKLFIFLALLFAVFFLSSAEETKKLDAKEEKTDNNEVEDAKYYGCKYRCCGRYGCRCCSFAEAQLMAAAQPNDQKPVEVADEGADQFDDTKLFCRYRCCGRYGCRCCTFTGFETRPVVNPRASGKFRDKTPMQPSSLIPKPAQVAGGGKIASQAIYS